MTRSMRPSFGRSSNSVYFQRSSTIHQRRRRSSCPWRMDWMRTSAASNWKRNASRHPRRSARQHHPYFNRKERLSSGAEQDILNVRCTIVPAWTWAKRLSARVRPLRAGPQGQRFHRPGLPDRRLRQLRSSTRAPPTTCFADLDRRLDQQPVRRVLLRKIGYPLQGTSFRCRPAELLVGGSLHEEDNGMAASAPCGATGSESRGRRARVSVARVGACRTIDELNSTLGFARSICEDAGSRRSRGVSRSLQDQTVAGDAD